MVKRDMVKRDMVKRDMVKRDMVKRDVMMRGWFSQELPSFSRVSRGFEEHASEPANAQLDAASWDGRGGCEADGVVTRRLRSHHPRRSTATPPVQPHRGGWRSAARRCAGTFFETPPHPQAGGESDYAPLITPSHVTPHHVTPYHVTQFHVTLLGR